MGEEENGKGENDSGGFAVCLKCGNRWKVRKLNAKKRKCPVCGSYRTRLESEVYSQNSNVEEEEKTENRYGIDEDGDTKHSDSAIPPYSSLSIEGNKGFSTEKEENSIEKEEKKSRKKQEKKQRRKTDDVEELDEEAIDRLIDDGVEEKKKSRTGKGKGRGWLIWIAAAILVLGLLYWFLGSMGKRKGREAPERRRTEQEREQAGIPGLF